MNTFQRLTPMEYLMCAVVCAHDKTYEKATWDDRIAKFDDLDFKDKNTFLKASNPIGMRAAYVTWQDAKEDKPVKGFVPLDASSSVLQLFSILVGCKRTWSLCGGDDGIRDAYTALFNRMKMPIALTRTQLKDCIMQSFYGGTVTAKETFGEEHLPLYYQTLRKECPYAWNTNIIIQNLWAQKEGPSYSWVMPDNFSWQYDSRE